MCKNPQVSCILMMLSISLSTSLIAPCCLSADVAIRNSTVGQPVSFAFQAKVQQILIEFKLIASSGNVHPATGKLRGAILAALAQRGLIPANTPGIDNSALTDDIR